VSDPHYHAVLPTVVPGERLMVRQWWPNDCAQLTLEVVLPECVAVLAANRVRCLEELTVTPAEGRWLRDRLTEVLDERPDHGLRDGPDERRPRRGPLSTRPARRRGGEVSVHGDVPPRDLRQVRRGARRARRETRREGAVGRPPLTIRARRRLTVSRLVLHCNTRRATR